jgi:hypothetical protein
MTSFLSQNFEALKKLVLSTAELDNITPGDCKLLSLKIYKKTNQQVSETTLKRVYGFAISKFNPSLFTIEAMATFCGFSSWGSFCEIQHEKQLTTDVQDVSWQNIKHNADKITGFTLQVLKNRSGIPYNLTIRRKFISDHFDAFLKGDYHATVLTAPAGYGKTIALCHWVEEHLATSNDIILFFSSNALINVFLSGKDINEWLLSLLGYNSDSDFSALLDMQEKRAGKFYIIVDGLDEHMFKKDQFHILLNQILDVFSFHQDHGIFKLILSMRSASWVNNRHEFESINQEWFFGSQIGDDHTLNVPLFSAIEIEELCNKINPASKCVISHEVAESFSHPLYFQYYYKQHKENFSFDEVDHLSIYELVVNFVLNKVYLGNYSVEKTIMNKAVIENMDFKNEKYEVHKLILNDTIVKNNAAYNELIGIGFLREINKSGGLQYNTVIQFGNNNFLNYSIARLFLFRNNNVFDMEVIRALNEYFPNERKLQLIKWCIVYAIKNGQQKSFQYLADTQLTINEKSDLLIFLGDMLKKETSTIKGSELMIQYFQQEYTDGLFNYFFGVEYINPDYKKTLQTILLFELSAKQKILVYTSLALIAVIQLNLNKLEEYLAELKSFSAHEMQDLSINPVSCIETIYYYLKYGIVKQEAFIELTKFYFNLPYDKNIGDRNSTNDTIYLLAIYTLSICTNANKIIRFMNAVRKVYKKDASINEGYYFMIRTMRAEANFMLGKIDEALVINDELSALYNDQKKIYTSFMTASFLLLKVKIFLAEQKPEELHNAMEQLIQICDQCDFKLLKAQALAFIIKNKCMVENDDFCKGLRDQFLKIVSETGFREESFTDTAAIMTRK